MESDKIKKTMEKQGYRFVGNHSAVKICRWTKKSLRNEGDCYKEKFYGIKSHLCCQITPWLGCNNQCVHCWRPIEFNFNKLIESRKIDSVSEIIDGGVGAQKKLLVGFKKSSRKAKQMSKVDMQKWREAQEPMNFAISLSGEPMIYDQIGELIGELRKRGKTSFLVTNGLNPKKILELKDKNYLPTQLYVSVNSSNRKNYKKFHRSSVKDAWEKLNRTLEILPLLNCRTVFRINLIKGLNMNEKNVKEFAQLIKKSKPMFVELKGFMSVGFARERLGYDKMPWHNDVIEFAEKLSKETRLKILGEHERSCAVVLGKSKKDLKITSQ